MTTLQQLEIAITLLHEIIEARRNALVESIDKMQADLAQEIEANELYLQEHGDCPF